MEGCEGGGRGWRRVEGEVGGGGRKGEGGRVQYIQS